jgi:hypothetical protein
MGFVIEGSRGWEIRVCQLSNQIEAMIAPVRAYAAAAMIRPLPECTLSMERYRDPLMVIATFEHL